MCRAVPVQYRNVDEIKCPQQMGSVLISGEGKILSIDIGKSEEEEFNIGYASELRSERFDFCIEWFSRSVCASVFKEVEDGFVVILDGSGHGIEGFETCLFHFIVPVSQFGEGHSLDFTCLVDSSQRSGQFICFFQIRIAIEK